MDLCKFLPLLFLILNLYHKTCKILGMSSIKDQIFQELNKLDDGVVKLRATAVNASHQTDLEVAILNEQVKNLREKNARATDLIDQTISILRILK